MTTWDTVEIDNLRKIDLFAHLSDRVLAELAQIMYIQQIPRGELILADGEPGRSMYVLMQGEVRISKHIPGLGEEALAILKAGSYFGEMGLLDDEPVSAAVWANKTCTCYVIDRQDLLGLMKRNQHLSVELLWAFVHTLSLRLRKVNSKVTFLAAAGKF